MNDVLRRWIGAWVVLAAGCAETVRPGADAAAPDAASPSDVPSPVDAPLDPATFLARQRGLRCANELRCPSAFAYGGATYPDAATCVAHFRRYEAPRDRQRVEAVGAGRMRFDEAAARRCLDDMTRHCPAQTVLWERCPGALTGALAVGAACELQEECADGLYCDHGDPSAPTCPGRCAERTTPPGTLTTAWASCRVDPGAVLGFIGRRCFSVRLAPPAGLGQPCDWIDEGEGRVRIVPCEDGLACTLHGLTAAGRCMRPLPGGASCAAGDMCEAGFLCRLSAAGARRCEAPDISREVGGPCTPGQPSGSNPPTCDPLRQLVCGDDGRCVRVGDGAEGSRCVPRASIDPLCDDGLYCDRGADVPTCRRRREPGAACSEQLGCLSGVCRSGACAERVCD